MLGFGSGRIRTLAPIDLQWEKHKKKSSSLKPQGLELSYFVCSKYIYIGHCDLVSWISDFTLYLYTQYIFLLLSDYG